MPRSEKKLLKGILLLAFPSLVDRFSGTTLVAACAVSLVPIKNPPTSKLARMVTLPVNLDNLFRLAIRIPSFSR
jgi:hypothetical protein